MDCEGHQKGHSGEGLAASDFGEGGAAIGRCGGCLPSSPRVPIDLAQLAPSSPPQGSGAVLVEIAPTLLLGEANVGKSPVAVVLSLMMARYWVARDNSAEEPRVRVTSDLDFFRGDPGTKYQPFVDDDGDMSSLESRKLKAFLDVGEEETMTKERYNAAKFVRNQLRIICDNSYCCVAEKNWLDDPEVLQASSDEDSSEDAADGKVIPLAMFLDMCKPAMGDKGKPHVTAIMKRAHFILNTQRFLYAKEAGSHIVKQFPHVPSYLTPDAGNVYMQFKATGTMPEAERLREDIGWEQGWLAELIRVQDEPLPALRDRPLRRWAPRALRSHDGDVIEL